MNSSFSRPLWPKIVHFRLDPTFILIDGQNQKQLYMISYTVYHQTLVIIMTLLRYNYYRLSRHWECFNGRNGHFKTFKNENFWFEKKILFEIPDQKTVLQATLKSEFSKNFFCTLISIQNTLKKISLTKSIDKSGHTLGDPFKNLKQPNNL